LVARIAAAFGAIAGLLAKLHRIRFLAGAVVGQRFDEIGDPLLRDGRAVEDDLSIADLDQVSGKPDHALDIVFLHSWRSGNDDVATFWHLAQDPALHERQQMKGRGNERPAIGIFGHDQPIAHQQARHHRFRRNVEGLGDKTVEPEHGKQQPENALDFRPPIDLVLLCRCHGFVLVCGLGLSGSGLLQ